ncbi:MAG: hypothetical protein J1E00_00780 [Oscillospiraceae bacterium]|nr:hypothetical protein [Oscillospiraceae bacterium]
MYKCKPERNVRQVVLLMTVSIGLTVGTFVLANFLPQQAGIIRFAAFLLAILALYVIVRFTMTEMEYTLDNGCFVITKIVGNKRTDQGVLDLADTVALVTREEYRAQGLNKNLSTICNYSQNIGGKHWFYVFEFGGKRAVVEFEPNDAFVAIFQEEIERAKSGDNPGGASGGNPPDDGILI